MPLFLILAFVAATAATLLLVAGTLGVMLAERGVVLWGAAAMIVAVVNTIGALRAVDRPSWVALGRYGGLSLFVLAGFRLVWPG